jgi:hypothetical protein
MRRRDDGDDDSLPVMVPRSDKGLAAIAPERVRRLREHLIEALVSYHPTLGTFCVEIRCN